MNDERFKAHMKRRFIRNLGTMQDFIRLNAPDVILAAHFRLMIDAATGFMGAELAAETLKSQLRHLRTGAAFCQHCESEVAIALSHPPICEQCEARIKKDCDDIDKLLGEEPAK